MAAQLILEALLRACMAQADDNGARIVRAALAGSPEALLACANMARASVVDRRFGLLAART